MKFSMYGKSQNIHMRVKAFRIFYIVLEFVIFLTSSSTHFTLQVATGWSCFENGALVNLSGSSRVGQYRF